MSTTKLIEALRHATVVDLEHPRRFGDPTFAASQPGTLFTLHRRHEPGLGETRTSAAGMIITAEHSGTHIDALCHQAEDMQMFGGVAVTSAVQTPVGFKALGIETVAPLVAPAILLDVAARRVLRERELITLDDVQGALADAHERIDPGDVVLVRTGFGAYWSETQHYLAAAGMSSEASAWLADRGVCAVGADNVAWDVVGYTDPELRNTLPSHVLLMVRRGIHIIENLALEELARSGVKRFVFVCLPLKVVGGTGSPVRPVAILDGAVK